MASSHYLRLHDEVLLLALHDEKGTANSAYLLSALGGALLAELVLDGRLVVVPEGKRGLVDVRDRRTFGDPILDECLRRVQDAKRRAAPASWVSRFGGLPKLKQRIARSLVHRGILREAEGRVLLVFSRRTWPTLDPAPERALIERVRATIFDNAQPDARTAILLAIGRPTGLLDATFGRRTLKPHRKRIEEIANGTGVGPAVRDAVEAVQASVIAATVAASVAASVATTAGS